jgi:hypothetical protein
MRIILVFNAQVPAPLTPSLAACTPSSSHLVPGHSYFLRPATRIPCAYLQCLLLFSFPFLNLIQSSLYQTCETNNLQYLGRGISHISSSSFILEVATLLLKHDQLVCHYINCVLCGGGEKEAKKEEIFNIALEIKKEKQVRVASEQDRTRLKRMIEERIMTIDTSSMTVQRQCYYDNLRDEIISQ